MSFDLSSALRRLKPQKRTSALIRRTDNELNFVGEQASAGPGLLPDTTVYIDLLQGRAPPELGQLLRVRQLNHSSVVVAELVHLFGWLDPNYSGTKSVLAKIDATINAIPPHRLTAPSIQTGAEAGIVSGLIARLKGLTKTDREPLLNDAMLYLQTCENGLTLLSRNVADFHLIEQLVPAGRVLFYRQAP